MEEMDGIQGIDQSEHSKEEELMPSVLVLPNNNYQALVPMACDFVDEDGAVLTAEKKHVSSSSLGLCSLKSMNMRFV